MDLSKQKPITTPEMEVALMNYLNVRVNLIVPNLSWGLINYEADIVSLSKSSYVTEIEIKISKSDLRADFNKRIQHDSTYFKYFYYAVPLGMKDFALDIIPERAGLFIVRRHNDDERVLKVEKVRDAKENPMHKKWSDKDRMKLAELGCMRILGLKRKLINKGDNI